MILSNNEYGVKTKDDAGGLPKENLRTVSEEFQRRPVNLVSQIIYQKGTGITLSFLLLFFCGTSMDNIPGKNSLAYTYKSNRSNIMKKLATLTLALFLTAGMAFGQNIGNVTQVGDDHVGNIDQVGYDNTGDIDQNNSNSGMRAFIEQVGNNNSAITDQDGDSENVLARTTQTGNDNVARQTQNVYGGPNVRTAIINQLGDLNRAIQDQSHSGGGGDISMRAFQEGDENYARQLQAGSTGNRYSLIDQFGDFNRAITEQTGIGVAHRANIDQDGNNNRSTVTQSN